MNAPSQPMIPHFRVFLGSDRIEEVETMTLIDKLLSPICPLGLKQPIKDEIQRRVDGGSHGRQADAQPEDYVEAEKDLAGSARNERIRALRTRGLTWREIAERFDISMNYAMMLAKKP